MLVKNDYDRQGLLHVGAIVALALDELCRAARPGITTASLDLLAAEILHAHGAEATPRKEYGFPGILCISVNDEVVHGVPGSRELREGDLIKLDLTADKRGYVADATRMALLPPAADEAIRLADTARQACFTAIAAIRPGMELRRLGGIIQDVAAQGGFRVIKELCGHGVGRSTHEEPEVPNYADRTNPGVLRENMVIAIEPILSCATCGLRKLADGWTMATTGGILSAHYEETVIVDANGATVATVASLP